MEEYDKTDFFQTIYIKYSRDLFYFACKFVSNSFAEDIVHTVFLRLWDKQAFCLSEEDLRRYLYISVRNLCIDHLRRSSVEQDALEKKRVQLKLDELDYYEDVDKSLILKDQMEQLLKKIEDLPPKTCEIFKMAYLKDMKNAEIAEQLGISVRTVENQLYRALLVLRKNCSHLLSVLITFGII